MNKTLKNYVVPTCAIPGCNRNVVEERSQFGLCTRHTEIAETLLWCLEHIKIKDKTKTDSGLIIPK
jgi:hypothetical protein